MARLGLLVEEADDGLVRSATRQILVGPAIYAAAIGVSFLDARPSLLVILLDPVIHFLPGPIHLHWTR